MMLYYYVFPVFLILLCFVFRWRYRKFYELVKVLGGDDLSLPFIGAVHLFVGGGEAMMRGIERFGREALKKKGMACVWLAHRFFVIIADPKAAEFISKNCLEKDDIMYQCMGNVLGNSSFVAPVSIWRPHRKILEPPFSLRSVRKYARVFADQAELLVERLAASLATPGPIRLLEHYFQFTTEAVCQTALGMEQDDEREIKIPQFISSLILGFELVAERIFHPWLHPDCIYKLLPQHESLMRVRKVGEDVINGAINLNRKQKQEVTVGQDTCQIKNKSLVDIMLEPSENGEILSNSEITDELLGVALAAMDTTAKSAGFISSVLARYPDVQEKVFEELVENLGNQETITATVLFRLKYLDAVIRETLRLYPPLPVIVRKVTEICTLPTGVTLPRGCGVMLHLWAINRSPAYWGADAEQFRPERFLDDQLKHPAQFALFSFGPRNCVGSKFALLSLKTLFASLLRRYRLSPASARAAAGPRLSYAITVKDADHFPVKLHLRSI